MIEKLFLQYGYKDFQHRRQFVDSTKLAEEYKKKFLGEKYNHLITEGEHPVGAASMQYFKSLSEIWNKNVFFLRDFVVDNNLTDGYKRLISEFFAKYQGNIDFMITKQPIDNYQAVNALIEKGFYYVCNEVVYTLDMGKQPLDSDLEKMVDAQSAHIRLAEEKDLSALKQMVYVNHKFNRYLFDPVFSPADVSKLYERVIEQSFYNPHHSIFVYKEQGKVLGFLTTIFNEKISYTLNNQYGSFDYIIVDEKCQKRGIGSALMNHALFDFKQKGIQIISVKTMANNYPSIRLLMKDGFFVTSQNIVLHYQSQNR